MYRLFKTVLTGRVLVVFALAAPAQASPCLDELTPSPGRFEDVFLAQPGSVEQRVRSQGAGGVHDRLVALERQYMHERLLSGEDQAGDALASELDRMAIVYAPGPPFLGQTLQDAAARIRKGLAPKKPVPGALTHGQATHRTSWVVGELGELRVAVLEAGVIARGIKAEDLGRFWHPSKVAARRDLEELVRRHTGEFWRELDIVFDGGRGFGEVKSVRSPVSLANAAGQRILEQARIQARMRRLMDSSAAIREAVGGPIRQRIYLLNGIEEPFAVELEELGIEVIGARFPPR